MKTVRLGNNSFAIAVLVLPTKSIIQHKNGNKTVNVPLNKEE